jgi:hypothetical protein
MLLAVTAVLSLLSFCRSVFQRIVSQWARAMMDFYCWRPLNYRGKENKWFMRVPVVLVVRNVTVMYVRLWSERQKGRFKEEECTVILRNVMMY